MAEEKILIVEDDMSFGKLIKYKLERLNYRVLDIVCSHEEVLMQINDQKPDLILMDIVLENEVDGIEIASQMRSEFNIPVIFISGYDEETLVTRAKTAEPLGYLIKPFDDNELKITVELALYKSKMDLKLKHNEIFYRSLIENISDAIAIIDQSGTVFYESPTNEKILGYRPEELLGNCIFELFHPEDQKNAYDEFIRSVANPGLVVTKKLRLKDKGGMWRTFEMNFKNLLENPAVKGIVINYHDVSEQIKAKAVLQDAHDALESSVIERTSDLINSNESLKQELFERTRVEEALKRRLEFEKTISAISSRFIGTTTIDEAIEKSLQDMSRLRKANRAYVYLFNSDMTAMTNSHEWCSEAMTPQKDSQKKVSTQPIMSWIEKLKKGEPIHIKSTSSMPEGSREKKSEFEGLGIKSLLLLPLHLKGVLAGFLGFDSIICVEEWNDDDIAILRVASEVIGRAIEHECQQEELRRHRHHLKDMLEERTKELKDLNGKLVTETDERKRLETQMRQMQEKESSELDPHIPSPLMHIRSESYPQN